MLACMVCVMAMAVATNGQISQETKDAIDARVANLETTFYTVARQLMMQRLALEESVRSDGDSGVKQIRTMRDGTKAYFSSTHTGKAAAMIHDHTELIRTCGMGELEAMLNGIHFRTRHNDYQLVRPSTTSGDYHAIEEITYPPVPPEVLNQTDLETAFRTLRSYFRAWLNGNDSSLDYKPYFKPLLCYLEGAWTNDVNLDEPFDSERHHLDALSWFDLQEKLRFTSYTGDKDASENFAYLPTSIFNTTDGQPVLAQWNYRILCHPIQDNLLELKDLKPVDDVHSFLATGKPLDKWLETRKARFKVSRPDMDTPITNGNSLLDRLMSQIPGKDNYQADIEDNNLGRRKYDIYESTKTLNAGFYHRWVFVNSTDAMGVQVNRRGFGDRNLFVAQTTQSRVVPLDLQQCDWQGENCIRSYARVTFAIPLEIVWTTPLNTWNPYDLEFKGSHRLPEGETVTADGRTGGLTADKAFNGTNTKIYMLTPLQFFQGGEFEVDPADTSPGGVGVLDRSGQVRQVTASGIRIFLPEILDVGNVRTRFPIFPVFAEGSTVYKNLESLSKIVLDLTANERYLHTVPQFGSNDSNEDDGQGPREDLTWYKLQTALSGKGSHFHYVDMRSKHALYAMDGCETYQVRTSLSKFHTHLMTIHYNSTSRQFEYIDCDGRRICRDNHGVELTPAKV